MTKKIITIKQASKKFKVPKKGQGKVKSIFYRKNELKTVLENLNFSIEEGEFIGYIGPNGAGKSTTIKLLTGIIKPTTGEVTVLGFDPHAQRYQYVYNIGVVFGQRSLLEYDIPVIDSFKLYKAIYEIDDLSFDKRVKEFSKRLKIDELLHIPVRKLSLGQRMRCEIAASLLHKPKIVFLDEPTIGLDAIAKNEIRNFLKHINEKEKVTIILTTHDMDDIEQLAHRIMLIDDGKIIYDGSLEKLKQNYISEKQINITTTTDFFIPKSIKENAKQESKTMWKLKVPAKDVPTITQKLLETKKIKDLEIHQPRLEDIVQVIYKDKKVK